MRYKAGAIPRQLQDPQDSEAGAERAIVRTTTTATITAMGAATRHLKAEAAPAHRQVAPSEEIKEDDPKAGG